MNRSSVRMGLAGLALTAAAVGVLTAPTEDRVLRADSSNNNDDISNYDGTPCQSDQFYDATTGACSSDAVSNSPNGVLPLNVPGISDPGTRCLESQDYDVTDQGCVPGVITNDPGSVVKPEGEDPTEFTVPTAAAPTT